ncbi:delta-6 elongase [Catenaria anguillulae PL171]|uniref:Elongation of fatty acids protein n=1 Tax=Catenaria anguillulae PL171 TaxID=765915 RepID=A0A1Y2HZW8_9FUNG|nr:delta-6 elongase [Catenaria anguillulae PL171]
MEATTDLILAGFFALEHQVASVTAPVEQVVGDALKASFPELTSKWTTFLASIKSPYADQLPFMNPAHMLALVAAYLVTVFAGKAFMSRMPEKFAMKNYALAHNVVLTSLSAFMWLEVLRQAYLGGYSLFGNGPKSPAENGLPMAKIIAVFYLSKILEFNDTFIMVLKKNFHQISFLHVYHHASIFAVWWLVTFWAPTGEAYFSAMLNSFIHVIMYGYYFLSAMGVKQVVVVKKYITSGQMTQFVCMMIQATYNILDATVFNPTPAGAKDATRYPLALSTLLWVYMVSMLALFGNFYRQDRKRDAARRAELAKLKATKSQ